KLNFGSQGVGTTPHLTGELFARVTGTKLTHVPYRGTAQAVNDLIAGNIDMLFFQLDSVREQYRADKVKMLAVSTATRIASVPRGADQGGSRRQKFSLRQLERARRAAEDAAGDRRQAQ